MQVTIKGEEREQSNTDWHIAKINSIHGKSIWFCKTCGHDVRVAEHITSISREDDFNIYWDYIDGECGHTLADWFH